MKGIKLPSILYLAITDLKKDGRSQTLIKHLNSHFDLRLISNHPIDYPKTNTFLITKEVIKNPIQTLFRLRVFLQHTNTVFIDNRKSCFFAFLLLPFIFRKTIIIDSREFYTLKDAKSIRNFFGTIIEICFHKIASQVIVANDSRARLTKCYSRLNYRPLVLENRRVLPANSKKSIIYDVNDIPVRLDESKINFISTSGFSLERNSRDILDAAKKLENSCRVFFIGKNTVKDNKFYHEYIKKNDIKNVFILKTVDFNQLKGLIKQFHVGIVNYSDRNLNNRYCASGKIFEFLDATIPVVTSTNSPLIQTIRKYNCGVATKNFEESFQKIIDNYEYFKNNVREFNSFEEIELYNDNFVKTVLGEIIV